MSGFFLKLITCSWVEPDIVPSEKVGFPPSNRDRLITEQSRTSQRLNHADSHRSHQSITSERRHHHHPGGLFRMDGLFHHRDHAKKHTETDIPEASPRPSDDVQILALEDYRIDDEDVRPVTSRQTYESCQDTVERAPSVIDRPIYVDNELGPGFN